MKSTVQRLKFSQHETKNTDDEKSSFLFSQMSGLCESYMVLCCATGGIKKPLLISGFAEKLDESIDVSELLFRTEKLQRQMILITNYQ